MADEDGRLERAIEAARGLMPGWQGAAEGAFSASIVTGGLTNKLTRVSLSGSTGASTGSALVRVFGKGTDEFVDRELEQRICAGLASLGVCPEIVGTFAGGRVEQFLSDARSLLCKDVHKEPVLAGVARLMATMHGSTNVVLGLCPKSPGASSSSGSGARDPKPEPTTPRMLQQILSAAQATRFGEDEPRKCLKLAALQVDKLASEVAWLTSALAASDMGQVLCHRDLQSGNVMVQQLQEEQRTYLIDFEYSGLDFCGFDFGNTFCEMSINNFGVAFPGFVLDPDMYPSLEQRRFFFDEYLRHLGNDGVDALFRTRAPDGKDAQIDKLCDFAALGSLASHLQWALWGVVQAGVSTIEWGFLEYATSRLDQFYELKAKTQAQTQTPSP